MNINVHIYDGEIGCLDIWNSVTIIIKLTPPQKIGCLAIWNTETIIIKLTPPQIHRNLLEMGTFMILSMIFKYKVQYF